MNLSKLAKRMLIVILIIGLLASLLALLYYRSTEFLPFFFGLLIGMAVSVVKVFMLDRAVDKAVEMDKNKAGNYIQSQHLFRLALSFGALIIAALIDGVNVWGAIVGVIAYQVATYSLRTMT